MKKISNISQLKYEQQRLKQEQIELEMAVKEDWHGVKESLRPMNITGQVLSAMFTKPAPGEKKSIVPWLLSITAAGLTGKLIAKAKKTVSKWLN